MDIKLIIINQIINISNYQIKRWLTTKMSLKYNEKILK